MFRKYIGFMVLFMIFFMNGCLDDNESGVKSSSNNNNSSTTNSGSKDGNSSSGNPSGSSELYSKIIKKTGQTKSYDEDGQLVSDGSIKDDGFYRRGQSVAFKRESSGVVKDLLDNLLWEDDDSVQSSVFSYKDAKRYCETLSVGASSNWRVPTIKELSGLVDYSKRAPSIDTAFVNTAYGIDDIGYWSSSSRGFGWQIWLNFFSGKEHWYESSSNRHNIRCVSGNSTQWAVADFTETATTVIDNNTHLEWQDNSIKQTSWKSAIDYCENLILHDKNDWHMPNIKELNSIVEHTKGSPAINSAFRNTYEGLYWTSTSYSGSSSYAWIVNFEYGISSYQSKKKSFAVRCVRGGE